MCVNCASMNLQLWCCMPQILLLLKPIHSTPTVQHLAAIHEGQLSPGSVHEAISCGQLTMVPRPG